MPTQKTRAYIYRCALAVLPLLIAFGVVTSEDAPLWVALVGAFLVPGLAAANTSTGAHRADEAGAVDPGGALGFAVTVLLIVFLVLVILKVLGAGI